MMTTAVVVTNGYSEFFADKSAGVTHLRKSPGIRSRVRSSREFSVDAKIFSVARKFRKKKFGSARSISSKNRRNRSHPRDF